MAQVKTVTTSAGENTITFDAFFPYIWIRNSGEGDITAANYSGASAGDIDTVSIKAGEIAMIQAATASVYIIGATTVELHAQGFAECPFKRVAKGGEQITVTPLSVTQNGTYTAPVGTAYSPVTVDVQEQPWEPLQDGYSNFWFELSDDTLSPWLNFSAKNADAVIDWGDGTGEQSLDTLTPTHTYAKAGRYVVKCKGVTGINRWLMSNFTGYSKTLTAIECNSEIVSFASYSFRYAGKLQNVKINNECSAIGQYSFAWTTIESINIPSSISTIDVNAFANNVILRELLLDECTVTAIPNSLCNTCAALKKVTVPSTVASIGNTAFYSCNSLSEIHIQATTPPTLGTNNFQGLPSNYIIYVPTGTGDTYKSAAGWSAYSDHILEEGEVVTRAMQRKFAKEAEKQLDEIEIEERK